MGFRHMAGENKTFIRRTGVSPAVFTDVWTPGVDEREIPEEELLPRELSAVTFRVGCYTVRSARRVYIPYAFSYGASHGGVDMGTPADKTGTGQIIYEISARCDSGTEAVFQNISRFAGNEKGGYFEYIGDIYAVKENESVPDGCASLLIYSHYEGGKYGIDTCYRLDPDGEVTKSESYPF